MGGGRAFLTTIYFYYVYDRRTTSSLQILLAILTLTKLKLPVKIIPAVYLAYTFALHYVPNLSRLPVDVNRCWVPHCRRSILSASWALYARGRSRCRRAQVEKHLFVAAHGRRERHTEPAETRRDRLQHSAPRAAAPDVSPGYLCPHLFSKGNTEVYSVCSGSQTSARVWNHTLRDTQRPVKFSMTLQNVVFPENVRLHQYSVRKGREINEQSRFFPLIILKHVLLCT